VDDRDEYDPEAEDRGEPVTERVRIIGAQPAGQVADALAAAARAGEGGPEDFEPAQLALGATAPGDTALGATAPGDTALGGDAPDLPAGAVTPATSTSMDAPSRDTSSMDTTSRDAPRPAAVEDPSALHPEEAGRSAPSGRNGGDPLEPGAQPLRLAEPPAGVPDMPHWTDPPTGQVPAVLDRRGDDDDSEGQWSAVGDTGPAWREHKHEWDDSGFDPSLLADDETRVGAMEETPVEERRPWEFADLGAAPAADDRAPAAPEGTAGAAWWDDADGADGADGAAGAARPGAAAAEDRITPEVADRGVASISSSPLRVGARDQMTAAPSAEPHPRGVRTRVPPPGAPRDGSGRNMPVAIATGVGIALLAVICFEVGSVATLVLATVVVALSAAECYAALRRSGRRPATFLGLVATVGVMVAAYAKGVAALPLVLVLVVIASMVWYLVGAERGSAVEGIAATVLGFAWVGLLGSFAALMLAPSQYPHRHGVAFVLGAIVATIGADVGALAVGSWLGRRPLAPHVSPNKTWEGLIGGAVVAIALSAAVTGQVHPWTVPKAALLGVVVAVVAPLGDLCESLVKRDLGLKDMGSMLPGHGGVLDRVDALLFVLPATYYLVRVLNLG